MAACLLGRCGDREAHSAEATPVVSVFDTAGVTSSFPASR